MISRNILWWPIRYKLTIICCSDVSADTSLLCVSVRSIYSPASTFFRAFCTCSEACWILRTHSWDVPSGCLTSVSLTARYIYCVIGSQCWDLLYKRSGLTDEACCCMLIQVPRLQAPVKIFSPCRSAVCETCVTNYTLNTTIQRTVTLKWIIYADKYKLCKNEAVSKSFWGVLLC